MRPAPYAAAGKKAIVMTNKQKNTLRVLDRTVILIEHGWAQGSGALTATKEVANWYDPQAVSFCILTASEIAMRSVRARLPVLTFLRRVQKGCHIKLEPISIFGEIETRFLSALSCCPKVQRQGSIVRYNDAKRRTKKQVLTLLRKTRTQLAKE